MESVSGAACFPEIERGKSLCGQHSCRRLRLLFRATTTATMRATMRTTLAPSPSSPFSSLSHTAANKWPLLDHLVGPNEDRRGHVKAYCLGGLHIDDQGNSGRKLNGQLRRLRTTQDAVDIGCGAEN